MSHTVVACSAALSFRKRIIWESAGRAHRACHRLDRAGGQLGACDFSDLDRLNQTGAGSLTALGSFLSAQRLCSSMQIKGKQPQLVQLIQ
jgi:hypothetical protein